MYLGPEYEGGKVLEALQGSGLIYEKKEDIATETASLLAEGKVVGWFQGRMEYGRRALGNRSILADPREGKMKAILNAKVKFREAFRPFGRRSWRKGRRNILTGREGRFSVHDNRTAGANRETGCDSGGDAL